MMTEDYREALKRGQKEYRSCAFRGIYPYLPTLDSMVSQEKIATGTPMGIRQVPAEWIVGTRTSGRTNAFARNFMPLLGEKTEFGIKWSNLCAAHLDEGIRDPVKVYEYLHRYYVEEGNKRVSVLKYFGAVTIAADVIRVLPEKSEDKEVKLYYEYIDFYEYSRINFLEFSRLGSYKTLQKLMGKAPEEKWTDDERTELWGAYSVFRRVYENLGGKKLTITVGDALLPYLRLYGLHSLSESEASIKSNLSQMWEEVAIQQEESPIEIRLTPPEKKSGLSLESLLPNESVHKIAFLYDKSPDTSGWAYGHELGREYVQRVFGDYIETKAYFNVMQEGADETIKRAIEEGHSLLFTTSPVLLPASLRAAVDNPGATILNCSLNKPHRYIRSYYARMYEAKFIIGAIAGAMAGDDPVGYICDYPIFGQIAGINAFALGVEMVNPRTRVYLEWSSKDSVEAATKRLTDRGIRLISSQDQARLDAGGKSSFGLSLVTEAGQVNLANPVWNWGVYYEEILRSMQDRSLRSDYNESRKALNYYWGMAQGVIEVHCTDKLPEGAHKLKRVLHKSICSNACDPFRGPIFDQGGHEAIPAHKSLTLEQIIAMDWLVENVVGEIPPYEELNPTGKATVSMVGVEKSTETPE